MAIVVRRLASPNEFIEAVEVQKRAWRMDDYREAVPAHVLRGLADNGGLVLGAFVNSRLVGVSYGWVSGTYFYSHATGVVEGVKHRGVGFMLKTEQRKQVLKLGIDLIKWTFDPLQSLNSRFNLSKLGVVSREYYINYYGEITDPINRGMGTDRVKAEWFLTSRKAVYSLRNLISIDADRLFKNSCIALESKGGSPGSIDLSCNENLVVIEIPWDVSHVKETSMVEAVKWREATRKVYSHYITKRGYILAFNITLNGKSYNILTRDRLKKILDLDIDIVKLNR